MKPPTNKFPTNMIFFTKKPFCAPSFEVKNASIAEELPASKVDKEPVNFEMVLSDQELAKDMFPPDYFMLVE